MTKAPQTSSASKAPTPAPYAWLQGGRAPGPYAWNGGVPPNIKPYAWLNGKAPLGPYSWNGGRAPGQPQASHSSPAPL